jgi:hypothetical protein
VLLSGTAFYLTGHIREAVVAGAFCALLLLWLLFSRARS